MPKNKQVIVLGRGRSGSSLVAGLIDKMGIDMGKSRPSSPNNPRGYFEDVTITALNDAYVQPIEENFVENEDFERELKKIAESKNGDWGWKQANTLYLLPSIVKVLDNPYFVVCHREPKKQAKSIRRALDSSRTEEETEQTIHDYYNLLEKFFKSNNYPRLDVQFENFFNASQDNQIKKLCGFVGGRYNPNLKDFIDPDQPKFK